MTSGVPSVGHALEQVTAWKTAQLDENQTKIREVDAELEKIRSTLANLQEQLTSLETVRAQLEAVDLRDAATKRAYNAIFEAMAAIQAPVGERVAATSAARDAQRQAVFSALETGELSPLVEEYKQFKEQVQPTLAALPESYRAAISQHHESVSEKIRDHLTAQLAAPPAVDGDPLAIEMVYGIDAPEGRPEVLICVLPIPDVTFTEWATREADLATHIGARVAQALYETTKRTGPAGAQAIRGGHQGLLAMEVDLEGASEDFPKVFADTLGVVLGSAPELAAAKVQLTARQVDFDYLLPPEEPEEEA